MLNARTPLYFTLHENKTILFFERVHHNDLLEASPIKKMPPQQKKCTRPPTSRPTYSLFPKPTRYGNATHLGSTRPPPTKPLPPLPPGKRPYPLERLNAELPAPPPPAKDYMAVSGRPYRPRDVLNEKQSSFQGGKKTEFEGKDAGCSCSVM